MSDNVFLPLIVSSRSEESSSTLSAGSILRMRDNVLKARRNNEKRIKEILFKRKELSQRPLKLGENGQP